MIHLSHISKSYGAHDALSEIDLTIPQGQIFGIIGRSGAGKSSLLRMLNLLERPSCGQVFLNDVDITALSPKALRAVRRDIGMIFQHFNLINNKTVYENIALPLQLQGYDKAAIEDAITPLLELTQMSERRDYYPAQLSGGQKQRVAIARALAPNPKVLLCDEATSALDPETTKTILTLLSNINKKMKITIVLITHEMSVVKTICDRVALIEQGRIVRDEAVLDFFLKPHSDPELTFLNAYLDHDIPEPVKVKLRPDWVPGASPVLRLYFKGDVVDKPLVYQLSQELGLAFNLLAGNIEFIKNQALGKMILNITKPGETLTTEALNHICDHLQQSGLSVEVLGYAS